MNSAWLHDRVDAVIFDHDGTLVDSETITLTLLATMAVEAGAEVYPDDADRFVGADLHLVLAAIEERRAAPLDREAFLDEFRVRQTAEIKSGLAQISGAAPLLDALTSAGVPIAVASNAPVEKMELCLGSTGLRRYFGDEMLVSAYAVERWKPDPAVFLRAASLLGHDPQRCAVVEDSTPGLDAATSAGMHVIALDPRGRFGSRTDVTAVQDLAEANRVLLG